ncbi:MAG TPA: TrbG/VirB9 family P-type conjugative transfer protein [Rhodospirillaceae bacterium]|nr:TrbG/VirB9 family P-type conjugative transfer protein [Rhodospirillaceae bacterium]
MPSVPAASMEANMGGSQQLLANTERTIDQQSRGDFPVMERGPSLPLGSLQRSWDRPNAASGQTAPGIVHYLWQADFIMSIRTRDFMVTTILLPNWERATELYLGDPVVFEAKRVKSNIIALRSRRAGADSNLTIIGTSGNVYNFYLRAETWNSTQVTDLTVFVEAPKFATDADSPGLAADGGEGASLDENAASGDYLRRLAYHPEDLRYDMKMYARTDNDAAIAPDRVYEDGVFTYFDFGDASDTVARPVVHQLVDGVDSVVNTRTGGARGNLLIAEAVGDFTLRLGGRVLCVRWLGRQQNRPNVTVGGTIPPIAPARSPNGASGGRP